MEKKKKIAIVGSGISGIGTLYALRQSGHEVHLYESQNRLGGHTNTVLWKHNATSVAVDTGFIVLNTATYRQYPQFNNIGESSLITRTSQFHCLSERARSRDRTY